MGSCHGHGSLSLILVVVTVSCGWFWSRLPNPNDVAEPSWINTILLPLYHAFGKRDEVENTPALANDPQLRAGLMDYIQLVVGGSGHGRLWFWLRSVVVLATVGCGHGRDRLGRDVRDRCHGRDHGRRRPSRLSPRRPLAPGVREDGRIFEIAVSRRSIVWPMIVLMHVVGI
ncbi:hypothetical protein B0T22DRAFT_460141 [Podospora appendiculata]|uniref:Uncharacterized protein n=1 Tax=Podospora appendiculata TaxID=314037 RepID=A0AAE1CCQ1_9PEZI|nr:hypothetical protein B0T22DRAFT_460141 [Podospora appendiculata]